jgi:serine/threonine protein phosphatase 1
MARILCIGDIHGNHKALLQCLKRSKFDYKKDTLIVLGDIVDGYPDTKQCFDELMKIKNLIFVWGNHDIWFFEWMVMGKTPELWLKQGGEATVESFLNVDKTKYIKFFKKALPYYIDKENRLFVHGGIPQNVMFRGIEKVANKDLLWDRDLAELVLKGRIKNKKFQGRNFKEIYLGHTSTSKKSLKPIITEKIILLDQGAGWYGKLSIMDINTKDFWQSDLTVELYPKHIPRKMMLRKLFNAMPYAQI